MPAAVGSAAEGPRGGRRPPAVVSPPALPRKAPSAQGTGAYRLAVATTCPGGCPALSTPMDSESSPSSASAGAGAL